LQLFEEHTNHQMMDALAAADTTYHKMWSTAPYKQRAKYIGRAATLMLEQREALARLATMEMGKRITESRGDIALTRRYHTDPNIVLDAKKPFDPSLVQVELMKRGSICPARAGRDSSSRT